MIRLMIIFLRLTSCRGLNYSHLYNWSLVCYFSKSLELEVLSLCEGVCSLFPLRCIVSLTAGGESFSQSHYWILDHRLTNSNLGSNVEINVIFLSKCSGCKFWRVVRSYLK